MIHRVCYPLVAGFFFWLGMESPPPAPPPPVIKQPIYKLPLMWCEPGMERERVWVCNQKRKSI